MQRREGLETPPKMSLREWRQASDPDEEPVLVLHIAITARGMKNVNWSVFLPEIVVDEGGNGIIQKKIPANELAYEILEYYT
jgi:hypothetical protein